MNVIICPTDFSSTANNAIHYASHFAEFLNARIILLHIMHVPAVDVYSPANVMNDMMDAQRKASEKRLDNLCQELTSEYECSFEYQCDFGFAAELICDWAEREKAGMVCMGTTGSSNIINRFLGSVSYETVKRSKVPVLVVPAECSFKPVDSIVVANDNVESLENELDELKELSHFFKPRIDIVTVEREEEPSYEPEVKWEEDDMRIVEISSHLISEAICRYVDENDIRLLALKRHQRNFIENLFHKSTIKQVLGDSHIPTLVFN